MKSVKLPTLPLRNQKGMVSITVTVVFIMVISLVVLGFSQVSRRNSREALDRQLSTQAFYAAEAGVNDVIEKVTNIVESGDIQGIPAQTECTDDTYMVKGGEVDKEDNVYYTCLLVNPNPDRLEYTNVTDSAIIVPLNAEEGGLEENTYKWYPVAYPASDANIDKCPAAGTHPTATNWSNNCPYGVMRIEITPIDSDTLQDINTAARKSMIIFVYPGKGGGTVSYNPEDSNVYGQGAAQGRQVVASCTDKVCELKISGLHFARAYAKVRMLYNSTPKLEIYAKGAEVEGAAEGESGAFDKSQIVIDATGKAQDVLRRIQVRVSANGGTSRTNNTGFSDYAIQSANSVCKLFEASPTIFVDRAPGLNIGC